MGGTFDPIHIGHLVAATEVGFQLSLDEVMLVPAGDPWQKTDRRVTEAEHRYAMAVLAVDRTDLTVSRVDIERDGPTFTVDTLRDLHTVLDPVDLFFITGADVLAGLPTWRDPQALQDLAHMVGVSRPGHEFGELSLPTSTYTILEIPGLEVSSTGCRRRLAAGEPIDHLVPAAVVDYIKKHKLYS